MANDEHVLRRILNGSATLPLYSEAVEAVTDLLDALRKEFASDPVDWIVQSPKIGRTATTIHARSENPELVTQTTTAMIDTAIKTRRALRRSVGP